MENSIDNGMQLSMQVWQALDKPIITLHDNNLNHALKEINQAASASCRSVEQVVNILSYLIDGSLEKQALNVAE